MALNFTAKEAKDLIIHHKELLSKLDYISKKATILKTNIQNSANSLVYQSTLQRIILDDCHYSNQFSITNPEIELFILHLYKYQHTHSAINVANDYLNYSVKNIKQSISALNPGPAGLSWVFGGKRAKENREQAYQNLSMLLNDSYGQMIPHLASTVDSADSILLNDAWEAYQATPFSFAELLKEECPALFNSKNNNPFNSFLDQLNQLDQGVSYASDKFNKSRDYIKSAAERTIAFNALKLLNSIPIEEVNKEKSGFRVKALKDAGIATMGDIYHRSIYQLSSINGISENAAYSLKRIAIQILERTQENSKIKLSSDNRDKLSTELIKTIYKYRLKKSAHEALMNLVQSRRETLSHSKFLLNSIGNGLPWLFFPEKHRAEIRSAFENVKCAIDGDYSKNIRKLCDLLTLDSIKIYDSEAWDDFQKNNIEYISILEEVIPGILGNDDSLYGLPEDLAREIQEEALFPDGLLCTLRRYQEWGVKYILHQKKVLLGDEMGLGKTVQAIATMVSLRNTGATHFIVVCPASVVTNWCREVTKHSKLSATKIHGTGRLRALKSWVKTGGVAITTFETTAYIKEELIEKIHLLIVDEAHYIKNPDARRSINVKRLCDIAERLLFMTGTALENKVEEMISLINILQPKIASSVSNLTFMAGAPEFRNRVAPVYYRRKREDVLTELPELIEYKEWCSLRPIEKEIYESNILAKNYAASRRVSWNVDDLNDSSKAARLLEIIEQSKAENRKVLIFSFFLDTIQAIGNKLGAKCYGPINGSVPPQKRQDIIDDFDKAPAGSVLLAQIQSGGTGLNIQSASVIVICEPQFKPSIENQAISRAYRMGQARNVLVYRLLCENTIDEKITDLLEQKQKLFDAFADKSVAAEKNEADINEIDDKKFGQIIQEEIDRINAEKESNSTQQNQ